MKEYNRILDISGVRAQFGGMMMELLLSLAILAAAIPFVFQYQVRAVRRAENLAIVRQMQDVQTALERYVSENADMLLRPVGRNITRVNIDQLAQYGLADAIITDAADKYQLRIIKNGDTLQGIIVLATGDDIDPLRTREIVGAGGMGFIDGARAYGVGDTWRAQTADLGITGGGIVETTAVRRAGAQYLWRVPSDNATDATMASDMNLGGHNIDSAVFVDARGARFDETLSSSVIAANQVVFENRTTLDKAFDAANATVAGALSADARNMDVSGTFSMSDLGKFSGFTAADLYTTTLTLPGLSISSDVDAAVLRVGHDLDMTGGRIDAMFVSVGFAGSITPRLVVRERIEDSTNPAYFWDATARVAYFSDVQLAELTRMAPLILRRDGVKNTAAYELFSAPASNKNATAADFMNALNQIQQRVRAKYRLLNLE